MISYADALLTIQRHLVQLPQQTLPLEVAHGRVLAEPLRCRTAIPVLDQAEVDGYALYCSHRQLPAGTELPLLSSRDRGRAYSGHAQGFAQRITRHRPLPAGTNSVLALVDGQRLVPREGEGPRLRLLTDLDRGSYVRRAGSDAVAGSEVLQAGQVLHTTEMLLASTIGSSQVHVIKPAHVGVLSLGQSECLDLHQVPMVNSHRDPSTAYLETMTRAVGAEIGLKLALSSCPHGFEAMLQQTAELGLDLVVCARQPQSFSIERMLASLREIGAELIFHQVAFQPGPALVFARLKTGCLFFGLSAEPAALSAGMRFFVMPALLGMQGRAFERPLKARLDCACTQLRPKHNTYCRARVTHDATGQLKVELPTLNRLNIHTNRLALNAWAVLPSHTEQPAGLTHLDIYPSLPGHLDLALSTQPSMP